MLRVAEEVRVFPLLTLDGVRSPHLDFVTEKLTNSGLVVEIERVAYEFQQGGNDMLRAWTVGEIGNKKVRGHGLHFYIDSSTSLGLFC
jgi:hypothetical protein